MTDQIISESTQTNTNESCCEPTAESQKAIEKMIHDVPMEMCPMAGFCKGMMGTESRGSGFVLLIPGALLIATGVLIILAPTILVWLVAASLILFGIIALAAGVGMRRFLAKS